MIWVYKTHFEYCYYVYIFNISAVYDSNWGSPAVFKIFNKKVIKIFLNI